VGTVAGYCGKPSSSLTQSIFSETQMCSVGANAFAVIEGCQRHARHRAVPAPGKQPRSANFAEDPVERLRRGIAGSVAFNRQGALVEKCAGKERRSHRLLAVAAVADADIDRLPLGLEPDRATQASAFPDHDILSALIPA
jgi:hypothetical protein